MSDLLPCPFCGNAPETGDYGHSVRAICRNCNFDLPIDGWQDRLTHPEGANGPHAWHRNEVIEECAKVCISMYAKEPASRRTDILLEIASRIRELKHLPTPQHSSSSEEK